MRPNDLGAWVTLCQCWDRGRRQIDHLEGGCAGAALYCRELRGGGPTTLAARDRRRLACAVRIPLVCPECCAASLKGAARAREVVTLVAIKRTAQRELAAAADDGWIERRVGWHHGRRWRGSPWHGLSLMGGSRNPLPTHCKYVDLSFSNSVQWQQYIIWFFALCCIESFRSVAVITGGSDPPDGGSNPSESFCFFCGGVGVGVVWRLVFGRGGRGGGR